jgi:type VI secretion system VgrG family protein
MRRLFKFITADYPGDTFLVVRFTGQEKISSLYRFEIDLIARDKTIDLKEILQGPARFSIIKNENEVVFNGILQEMSLIRQIDDYCFYKAVLVPRLWWLSNTMHNQVFLNKPLPEILSYILQEGGLVESDFEFRLQHSYPALDYVCQYNETHIDFLHRWLEQEGLYYYFEQTGQKEKLIITDSRMSHVGFADASISYVQHAELTSLDDEIVFDFYCHQKQVPNALRVRTYNNEKPGSPLDSANIVSDDGFGRIYWYGDRLQSNDDATKLLKIRTEEIQCREREFAGQSNTTLLRSGFLFTLKDHFKEDFNQQYLVESVKHKGSQAAYLINGLSIQLDAQEKENFYQNKFLALDARNQYRPKRQTRKKRYYGFLPAKIDAQGTGEYAELDEQGRYKVVLPFDISMAPPGKHSVGLRLMHPYAGPDEGFHFPLRKGAEVVLAFIDGDPDQPVIAGAMFNSEQPDFITSENQYMGGIKTARGNQISFNDMEEHKRISISTGDGRAATIWRSDKVDMPSFDLDFSLPSITLPSLPGWPELHLPRMPWPPPPIPMPEISFPDIVFPQIQLLPLKLPSLRFQHYIECLNDYVLIEVNLPEIHFNPIEIPPVRFPKIKFADIPFPYTKVPPPEVEYSEQWGHPHPSKPLIKAILPANVKVHFPDLEELFDIDIDINGLEWPVFEGFHVKYTNEIPYPGMNIHPEVEVTADALYVHFPELHFPEFKLWPDLKLPSLKIKPVSITIDSCLYNKVVEIDFPDFDMGTLEGPVIQLPSIQIPSLRIPWPPDWDWDWDFSLEWPDFRIPGLHFELKDIEVDEVINKAWDITNMSQNSLANITYHNFTAAPFVDMIASPALQKLTENLYKSKIKKILEAQQLNGRANFEPTSLFEEVLLNAVPSLFVSVFGFMAKEALKREITPGESKAPKAILERLALCPKEIVETSLIQKAKNAAFTAAKKTAKKKVKAFAKQQLLGGHKKEKINRPPRAPIVSPSYGITILSSVPKKDKGKGVVNKVKAAAKSFVNKNDPRNLNTIKLQQSKPHVLLAAKNGAIDMIGDTGINVWSGDLLDISSKEINVCSTDKIHTEATATIDFEAKNKTGNQETIVSMTDDFLTLAVSKNRQFKCSILMNDSGTKPAIDISSKAKINLDAEKNTISLDADDGKIAISAKKNLNNEADEQIELKCGSASIVLKKDGTITLKCKKFVVNTDANIDFDAKSSIKLKAKSSVSLQGNKAEIKSKTELS